MSQFGTVEKRSSLHSRAQTPEFNKAKGDLLSLGIDLDDDLIQRLQTNLGIERIFSVARKAATLMKDKPHSGTGGTPNIIYRNVSANHSTHGASLSPFKNMIHMDNKMSESILKDLSNRNSAVEPQHRPAVDKLLESFGVQYARSPDRFVSRMLGRKYKSTDKSDAHSISKLVLKARYVSEEDFATMITRVDGAVTPVLCRSLFHLLCEEKSFALNKKRAVVDLWGFFTLLKTASEQSRRSFDSKTSKIASDVEFWKSKNPSGNSAVSGPTPHHRTGKIDLSTWLNGSGNAEDLLTAENNMRFNPDANKGASDVQARLASHKAQVTAQMHSHFSVAELLGTKEYKHLNDCTHGRQIMGNFAHEFENKCDVASALHSPLRARPEHPARGRVKPLTMYNAVSMDDSGLPGNRRGSFTASGNSNQMGDALGGAGSSNSTTNAATSSRASFAKHSRAPKLDFDQEREGVFGTSTPRAASAGRARPASASHVRPHEPEVRASVASALGFGVEDGHFPRKGSQFGGLGSSAEETARLSRRNSFGQLSRDHRSLSVASVMGGGREDQAGRAAPPSPTKAI